MNESNKIKIAEALNKAQSVMCAAKKDKKNPFFKSNYADLASVFDAIREPFAENGLSVSQTTDVLENGKMVLKTLLLHVSGEYLESKMLLPDEPNPQKLGSLLTYYRRYSLMGISGLPAEDDDGNKASNKEAKRKEEYITPEQVSILEELINGNTSVRQKVLENCDYDLNTITVQRFPGAVKWIKNLIEKEENVE